MSKWNFIDTTYIYDGSFEGVLSAINKVLNTREIPYLITSINHYVPDLFKNTLIIETEDENNKLIEFLKQSDEIYYTIYLAFFSKSADKEMIILKYIVYYDKYKRDLVNMKHLDVVINLNKISKEVAYECHKFKGFLRFSELKSKILYAEFEPQNDIVSLIYKHFQDRLPNEFFIINDILRNKAILCHKNEVMIVDSSSIDRSFILKSQAENLFSDMWKGFFKAIAIEERTNRRCQMNFMPKRFWKHLTEMEKDDE